MALRVYIFCAFFNTIEESNNKGDAAKMNLIRCQKDCVHQNEGYCGLDRAAAVTCAELNQCSFYRGKMPAVERDLPYHVPPFGDPVHTDEPHKPADTRFIQTEEKA